MEGQTASFIWIFKPQLPRMGRRVQDGRGCWILYRSFTSSWRALSFPELTSKPLPFGIACGLLSGLPNDETSLAVQMTGRTTSKLKTSRNVKCKFLRGGPWAGAGQLRSFMARPCGSSRWMSVLQNSKEEALNNAFKGDDNTGENNIVQELTKEIISEVQRMTGNDVCCDCGAPGNPAPQL